MATTNVNTNSCFGQLSNNGLNYHVNSCKIEASHPHLQSRHFSEPCHRNDAEVHRILISNNTYYGHHVKPSSPVNFEIIKPMDCEMMPISTHHNITQSHSSPLGRKRSGDDISFANIKRLKQEETMSIEDNHPCDWNMQPPHREAFASRSTHTNPDITRCLMAHMI